MTAPDAVLGLLMLAFDGFELPPATRDRLRATPAAGVTLFRFLNVDGPSQVRALTDAIQRAAAESGHGGPLLIAADQEGGQFVALGDASTQFAGNMALGAAGDAALTERVAAAIGNEMRAMGVNVAYAPCCDVASDPGNPGIGIRSFGEDPALVSAMTSAWVRGVRSAGVAASAKHFPGTGGVTLDSHHVLPVIDFGRERLHEVELAPFRAAIEAGVDLVMSAHVAPTALTGDPTLPATLSRTVMHDLLRDELGFEGLAISDALDMRALPQGPEQAVDVIAAMRAGMDLLLLAPDEEARVRIERGLAHAATRGLLDPTALAGSAARLARLRSWLAGFATPDPGVVGSAEHQDLARELAERSVTLVRNDAGLLPLRLDPSARIATIMPRPRDLTPADTSSRVAPALAAALRVRHAHVDEFVTAHPPSSAEIAALREQARSCDLLVIGTIAAPFDPNQVALVETLLATGRPSVTVALRTPYDLAAYPRSATHLGTYGLLRPSLDALASALFGDRPYTGRLPVGIPGLYPVGHGLTS